MPFVDTSDLKTIDRYPGWRGRIFHSAHMTFAYWEFEDGASIHNHNHEQEEVWHVIEGELEVTIGAKTQRAGPGMAAIVPPHTAHSVRATQGGRAIVADFPLREFA